MSRKLLRGGPHRQPAHTGTRQSLQPDIKRIPHIPLLYHTPFFGVRRLGAAFPPTPTPRPFFSCWDGFFASLECRLCPRSNSTPHLSLSPTVKCLPEPAPSACRRQVGEGSAFPSPGAPRAVRPVWESSSTLTRAFVSTPCVLPPVIPTEVADLLFPFALRERRPRSGGSWRPTTLPQRRWNHLGDVSLPRATASPTTRHGLPAHSTPTIFTVYA